MPKAAQKSSRQAEEDEDLYYDEDEEVDEFEENYDEDLLKPGDFPGMGADQDIAYMVYKFKKSLLRKKAQGEIGVEADIDYLVYKYRRNLLREQSQGGISEKRQKGKAPSSEHPSHFGLRPSRPVVPPLKEDDVLCDPDYVPTDDEECFSAPSGRGQSVRGRGGATRPRGRPRGSGSTGRGATRGARGTRGSRGSQGARGTRGRGRGGNISGNVSTASSTDSTVKKWNKLELKALIWGANHLKPILKGKFKASSDGRTMKKLAWEELAEYVESIGKREWKVKQCKDKLLYFSQDAKRKRQYVDNKYRSGSGQREEKDYLTDFEEAILDWVGEDVVLGIPGMQPPNLKGGGRTDQAWSCYDPERDNREDYGNLAMPSDAMKAVMEGDLLATDEEGDPLMDEEDYNEPVEEEDVFQSVDHYRHEDGESLLPRVVVEQPNTSLADDDDLRTPPPASVTRQKMLLFNKRENDKKKGIQSKKKPPEEDLSPHARERVDRRNELLKEVKKVVTRNTPKKPPTSSIPKNIEKPSSSVYKQVLEKPPPRKEPEKVVPISEPKPVDDTSEPATKRQRTRPPSFTELMAEGDISGVEMQMSPVFKTSTPAVNYKEGMDKSPGNKRKTDSIVDLTAETSDSKRRKLDYGNPDDLLPSLNNMSKNRCDAMFRSDLKNKIQLDMEETRNLIMDHNKKLCEALMKHQDELAQNTQETASIMVKSLKGVTSGITAALREHSHETARCVREQRDSMLKAQEKYIEEQRKEAEEDTIALGNVHTQLTNAIVTKQVQLVKALEKLSEKMVENTEKVAESQGKMNAEVVHMQGSVASLSQSFSGLIINVDHLQQRCSTGMRTVQTVDDILKEVTTTVHKLNQAVTYSFDHNLIRALSVRSVGTETEEGTLQTPGRVSEKSTDLPQEGTDKPGQGTENHEEGTERPEEDTTSENNGVSAFLTHPYTEEGVANYHTTEQVFEETGSISRNISAPLIIPGAAICQEATESNDGLGLPTFTVKSSDDFVIVQDTAMEQVQFEGRDKEQTETQAEEPTEGGDTNTRGDTKAAGEGSGHIEEDAKSAGGVESTDDAGSVSDRDEMPMRKSKRLRIKKQLHDFQM